MSGATVDPREREAAEGERPKVLAPGVEEGVLLTPAGGPSSQSLGADEREAAEGDRPRELAPEIEEGTLLEPAGGAEEPGRT